MFVNRIALTMIANGIVLENSRHQVINMIIIITMIIIVIFIIILLFVCDSFVINVAIEMNNCDNNANNS